MNEYQNARENCAFLKCGLCRRYLYVGISQDIRSSSSHMYYYIVVLKNLAKLTEMHLHESLFSTCNLQLHRKRDVDVQTFSVQEHVYCRKSPANWFQFRILSKMENRHSYYNKDISRSRSLFQKTDIARENLYLRTIDRKLTLNLIVIFNSFADISFQYVAKIFCISYYFQEKICDCFKVQLQWLCLCT